MRQINFQNKTQESYNCQICAKQAQKYLLLFQYLTVYLNLQYAQLIILLISVLTELSLRNGTIRFLPYSNSSSRRAQAKREHNFIIFSLIFIEFPISQFGLARNSLNQTKIRNIVGHYVRL